MGGRGGRAMMEPFVRHTGRLAAPARANRDAALRPSGGGARGGVRRGGREGGARRRRDDPGSWLIEWGRGRAGGRRAGRSGGGGRGSDLPPPFPHSPLKDRKSTPTTSSSL